MPFVGASGSRFLPGVSSYSRINQKANPVGNFPKSTLNKKNLIRVFLKNRGTPKSSILIGSSIINHPFWGTTILGNTHSWVDCFFLFFFQKKKSTRKVPTSKVLVSVGEGRRGGTTLLDFWKPPTPSSCSEFRVVSSNNSTRPKFALSSLGEATQVHRFKGKFDATVSSKIVVPLMAKAISTASLGQKFLWLRLG